MRQGKNWQGEFVWPPCSSGRAPLEKCQNEAGESVLDNLQLNNSLTHSNFRYFTFSGENIKIWPPWKNVTLAEKKFNFDPAIRYSLLAGWGELDPPFWRPMNIILYTDSKHDESILIMFKQFPWVRPFSSTFQWFYFWHTFELAAPPLMSDYIFPVFYHLFRSFLWNQECKILVKSFFLLLNHFEL